MVAEMSAGGTAASLGIRRPTIKGIFVNSHVRAVRRALGDAGVAELERRLGQPISYRDLDDVLVADEVRLIEHALDLTATEPVPDGERAYQAGRLHFTNFKTTPWAKMIFALFPRNFGYMLKHAPVVAERVFKGVRFESREIGPTGVLVIMENNDYPIDHFRGLFHAWMEDFGLEGHVVAQEVDAGRYQYLIEWVP